MNSPYQRKTSNFFPRELGGDAEATPPGRGGPSLIASHTPLAIPLPEFLRPVSGFGITLGPSYTHMNTTAPSSPFQFTKRHNLSPLIGSKFFSSQPNPTPGVRKSLSTSQTPLIDPFVLNVTSPISPDLPSIEMLSLSQGGTSSHKSLTSSLASSNFIGLSPSMPLQSIWSNSNTPIIDNSWTGIDDKTPKLDNFHFETSDVLFSPFYEEEVPPIESSESKRHNIYSSKVNSTPTFIPRGEQKVEGKILFPDTKRPEFLGERLRKVETRTVKAKVAKEEKYDDFRFENVVVNLPKSTNIRIPRNEALNQVFLRQLTNHGVTYSEDHCSTFYKRNKHKYMFIKESSNSLKVNNSGNKSFVTIKLKFTNDEAKKRKLKVDIKNLPVWKPINVQQMGYDKSKKRRDDKRRSKGRRERA